MEKFIYRNPMGQSITIQYGGTYILDSYDGLSAAEIIPITTKGYRQNGITLNHTSLGTRIINIYFYVHTDSMLTFYEKRRYLAALFNPLLGEGVLTYTNDFTTKSISVLPTVLPTPVEKYGTLQLLNIELTANNPFWYDTVENVLRMGDYENGFTFPMGAVSYPFATLGSIATIHNYGDWTTPLNIEFRGPADTPKINLINTGEAIEVNKELIVNEKLWINTAYGNKTVIYEEDDGTLSSAYNLITNASSFFQLQMGENNLSFESEGGQPEVYLRWRDRFVGV